MSQRGGAAELGFSQTASLSGGGGFACAPLLPPGWSKSAGSGGGGGFGTWMARKPKVGPRLMSGPNPNAWKQDHAWAQADWLLVLDPVLVQSNSPSFRYRAFVAAAYARPMACSTAFPRLTMLVGCCRTTDSYKGKRLSNSFHCTLQRSSPAVPLLKSTRAPSCRALHPKSWQGLLGSLPPCPSDNHNGHPAFAAAYNLLSKDLIISLTASPGGGHFGGGWGGGAETDDGGNQQHFVSGPSADGTAAAGETWSSWWRFCAGLFSSSDNR